MPVSEIERMELVGRLQDAIGRDATETLMGCVLPEGRDQLATKADLEVLGAGLRAEMAELRTEYSTEMAGLRAFVESGFAGVHVEIAGLRAFVESALAKQARLHYGALVAFLLSVWGVFLAQNFM
ncbi:MAG: hypothetical protein OXG67_14145 [bacterium]|nr:hypothetical protein [bacterium]MCY3889953.1 hypothetical protein [bacterium]